MSAFEEILYKQRSLLNSVNNTVVNFKKLGQTKRTCAVIKARIETTKERFEQCRGLDAKLRVIADDMTLASHPYFTGHEFANGEEAYDNALDYLYDNLEESSSSTSAPGANVSRSLEFPSHFALNLPRVSMPDFDGSYDKWESFRDRFHSMIIAETSLSNVQRLHHLLSCVQGEAKTAIEHLPVTSDNFAVAWQTLSSRYENKRRLISTHLNKLFTLPPVMAKSAQELRALRDQVNAATAALRNLTRPVDQWSDIIVFLITQKLDKASREAWELKLGSSIEYPTYAELDAFLESRTRALDAILPFVSEKQADLAAKPKAKSKSITSLTANATKISCPVCATAHLLYQCPEFVNNKTPAQRYEFIRKFKRCFNCFSSKHLTKECPSQHVCKQCQKKHHTLLHFPEPSKQSVQAASSSTPNLERPTTNVVAHVSAQPIPITQPIILATARIRVYSVHGRYRHARALIDQGSASSFVTEKLAQALRLPKSRTSVNVTGIAEAQTVVRHAACITITPGDAASPAYSTTALILRSLSRYSPPRWNFPNQWPHLTGLHLADPNPTGADSIDVIIGADLFGSLILDGVRKRAANEPVAQNTVLGWIISGPTGENSPSLSPSIEAHHCAVDDDLDLNLRRFWELEEVPRTSVATLEDQACENHFSRTHYRNSDGRYVVRLPFKNGPPISIGDSRTQALQNYLRTESRLKREPSKATAYQEFLKEYADLGHMQQVPKTETPNDPTQIVFIPHHAVFRESSATTRVRVVFNASSRTTNGTSLNDHLLVGPKLQKDLSAIVLQWRLHRYVYSADVAKMYRQIQVASRDCDYQRIFWRPDPSTSVEEYRLLTVTYGTACAPYLALRVMNQLALDEGASFPLAIAVINRQTYVDDFIFGADDKSLARQTRDQVVALLEKGGFTLRKWASNSLDLLKDIDPKNHGLALNRELREDERLKILGLTWNPDYDVFQFHVNQANAPGTTKRRILSDIAKLFDPLGWATPVIIRAKILMQQLWASKCEWDEPVPVELLNTWRQYYKELPEIEKITIPRWTQCGPHSLQAELHGFSDASTKAYAAVVYQRVVAIDGTVTITLLAAKSKVAPLKTISVPRLELSAAHLLAKLLHFCCSSLDIKEESIHCWTDSTITLAWLSRAPAHWKTFVANRVAEIQTLLPTASWRHIPTRDNPADCASRGISPAELASNHVWWSGPAWLIKPSKNWPTTVSHLPLNSDLEERTHKSTHTTTIGTPWDLSERYSSWWKLLRITAYIQRFVRNLRDRQHVLTPSKKTAPTARLLSPTEIEEAEIFWLRSIQANAFPSELKALAMSSPIPKSSSLLPLNPFLDNKQLLRVGGRLRKANLAENARHPIVLKDHPLVRRIIRDTHLRALHAGSQLTVSLLREKYWILRARSLVRAVLYQCVVCTRERAQIPTELMGDLPRVRVTRSTRAFTHVGVDYAGPVLIRTAKGRGHKSHKAYISVFICMVTKAIHLELVSDYSTSAFISAFHRFTSRRGVPQSIYSDNGTTFQGADRELRLAIKAATENPDFNNQLATHGTWHFIPPSAPHFGGLWEAAVRSVKYHLKRCVGSYTLTFEELHTVLCRIEACLNSRPIASESENLDDYKSLTPGHFLIGGPLLAVPEPSVLELHETRLSRWQLLQRITEDFWKSWSHDYLLTLQQRPK